MNAKPLELPESLREKVKFIGPSVSSEDIDAYGRWRDIENKSYKLQKLLEAWERQHTEERAMRKTYATALLVALGIQMLLVNSAFFLIGFGLLRVEQWVANTFIMAVFGEIAGMTFFIIKYLFPKVSADVLSTVEKL
jgi:hypothetical protein